MDLNARPNDPWWLKRAFAELGITEDKRPGQHNPRIVEYLAFTNLGPQDDETPWCAAFVRWCLGLRGGANARSLLSAGSRLVVPKRGCIAVLSRPEAGPKAGHVGFWLLDEITSDGRQRIQLLGGNQRDAVSVSAYPYSRLVAYVWPVKR